MTKDFHSSSNVEDPLSRLASSFLNAKGSKEQQLSKERLADLIGRAKLGDIEGLASEVQLSNREALRFAKSLALSGNVGRDGRTSFPRMTRTQQRSKVTAMATRQILRTPDARKLARELLAIFAKEASSKFASNRFAFLLSPTLDEKTLQSRFETVLRGRDVFVELQKRGKLSEARKLLSTLSLSQEKKRQRVEEGRGVKRGAVASKESDVIRYFTSRRRMIEIADSFLTDFSDIKTLTAFLLSDKQNEDASVSSSSSSSEETARSPMKNALKQIMKYLKEADELGVPDAEGVVSDGEIAINDDLQSKRRSGGSLDRERVKQLIENQVVQISSMLGMNQEEEDDFTKACL